MTNPLWKPNLEAIGRKDGMEGRKPRRNFITDEKYRQAYSDGRAKKIDEELRRMPQPKPGSWGGDKRGFGNAGSGGTQKELRPACLDLVVFAVSLTSGVSAGVWWWL